MRMLLVFFLCCSMAWAGPGAHGPNGEHLDGPATTHAQAPHPQLETHSESFELLAELQPHGLQVWLDRYDSNEPVLNASLDLEVAGIKAQAHFDAQQGVYEFADAALLKQLQQTGQHALVFTLSTEQDADLLEGNLQVQAASHVVHDETTQWHAGYAALLLIPLALFWLWRRLA